MQTGSWQAGFYMEFYSSERVMRSFVMCYYQYYKISSGDEIANVNFYAVRSEAIPEFAEITQNNGHYAVQGHSRSPILVPIESSYTISYW